MKRRPLFVAAIVFAGSFASQNAFAQAWTRDAGHAYTELNLRHLASNKLYGRDFEIVEIPTEYQQLSLGFYGEVGVVDRWLMATISAELYRQNRLAEQGSTAGLGDLRLGVWSGLIVAPIRVSTGVVVGLPTGDPMPDAGKGADADAMLIAASLPTGDGEFDLEPRVAVGTSFGGPGSAWPLSHYAVAELGYAIRTEGIHDAVTYKLELGSRVPLDVLDRILLIVRLTGTESFLPRRGGGLETRGAPDMSDALGESDASVSGLGPAAGMGDGVTFTSIGAELLLRIHEGLGLAVGVDTAFRARGLVAAKPFKLSLSYSF